MAIDKVGKSLNIYFRGVTQKNAAPVNSEPKQVAKEKAEVNELPAVNYSMVKAPMTYMKNGEVNLPYGLKATFYKLANGQKVVVIPKEGETVLKTYVNTGSMNETDDIRGISHYIEHNLFNGSEGLEAGEFFKTTDKMGAETNASTGMAETNYYISSHLLNDGDLEKKIRIHASMIESPRFAINMLEKEKGIVNSEINMITSNPENIAYNNTLKNLFNIKTTSKDVIAGATSNISNLTRDDVVKYFDKNYYPANMVTVVSGEVEPEETIKLIAKYFTSNKVPPQYRHYEAFSPVTSPKREDIISNKAHSTFITMGFVGPENNNTKDRICLDALGTLMVNSSKANRVFDPLNTAVGLTSEKVSTKPDGNRAIMLTADVSEENSEKLLKTIYSQIAKYKSQPVSQEELDVLKNKLNMDFAESFEYSSAINNQVGEALLENNMQSVVDYEKIIDSITPQDIQNTAKKYFDTQKVAITVLHPAEANANKINSNYQKTNAVSFAGTVEKQAIDLSNVKQYDLPNNYRVVLNNSKIPAVSINFNTYVPNSIKVDNPATYLVLDALLSEGSLYKNNSDLAEYEEKYGINTLFSSASGTDAIGAWVKCDSKNIDKALDLLQEVVENPRFDETTFNKVKKNLRDSINRSEKTPWDKLNPQLFKDKYFEKQDVLDGLEKLTLNDVKSLYNRIMTQSGATFTVSAPLENGVGAEVLQKISGFKPVKRFSYTRFDNFVPQEQTKVLEDVANKSQAKIVAAYKFKDVGNMKDQVTIELLNTILGGGPTSRLFDDLREKQKLAYSVRSQLENDGTTAAISLIIGTTTDNKETGEKSYDNLQKSIDGFNLHVNKLKNEKISLEELDSAKLSLKNSILSACESVNGKNAVLSQGLSSYYGITKENQYLDMIDKITVDDIYNAAQKIFAGKPIYSIVATSDTLDYNKEYLENLKNS